MGKLKFSTAISKFCCINDLIRFMMNEAEKLIKGSVNEDNFCIFHDPFFVNESKGNNKLDETEQLLTYMVSFLRWAERWDSLHQLSCW